MKRFAVIGNPVAHSRSPEIHAMFAQQAGLALGYERLLSPLAAFSATARNFVAGGGSGFNVTVPFKHEAFELVDTCSDDVTLAEAVNTVTVGADGKLHGDNTDGQGLVRDIEKNLGWQIKDQRILIVGAGGAVAGVLPALARCRPTSIDIFNRTHEKAQRLAGRFADAQEAVHAVRAEDLAGPYHLIVSGTSAGLSGEGPDIDAGVVGKSTKCYDMIYSAETTAFNRWAMAAGCSKSADGLGMLVEQAALAFNIWLAFAPDTQPVIQSMRELIHRS